MTGEGSLALFSSHFPGYLANIFIDYITHLA